MRRYYFFEILSCYKEKFPSFFSDGLTMDPAARKPKEKRGLSLKTASFLISSMEFLTTQKRLSFQTAFRYYKTFAFFTFWSVMAIASTSLISFT